MTDGNTHAIAQYLDEREDWDTLQGLTAELEQAEARIEELEVRLEKAEVIVRIIASDKWEERLGEAVDLSCEYLAELMGDDDDE